MRTNSLSAVGGDYDLRKSVPTGVELSWPSTADMGHCYVCSKLNTSPTLLRPCDHLICQSCARCAASNALCPICRVGVTGSDCDHTRLLKLRELAIARCAQCNWQGNVDGALVHKCQARQYVTHILWDLDNIQPPHGQLVHWYIAVAQTLEKLEFANRYTIKGALYFRSGTPAPEVKMAAEKLRLQLRPASLKPEATDRLIAVDIQTLVEDSKHAPLKPKVVLISSDTDCIPDVRACEIAEIQTCVIHNAEPNSQHERLLQYQPTLAMRIQDIVQEHQEAIRPPTSQPRPLLGVKKAEPPQPQVAAAPPAMTQAAVAAPILVMAAKSPQAVGQSPDERTPPQLSTGNSSLAEEAHTQQVVSDLPRYQLPPAAVVPPPAEVVTPPLRELEAPAAPIVSTPQKHADAKKQQAAAPKSATPKASRDVTAPALKAALPKPFFGGGLVEIDGKPIVAMDLMRNEGFLAVQNGERSPHLCNLKAPHDAELCTLLHYSETKPKTPTASTPKSWGGVASTPPPKPPAAAPTVAKTLAAPPKAERLFSVDGEFVPESKLIRNGAVEYLENNPHAKGRCCTNTRQHEAKACTFIHFKKLGKK